MSYKPQKNEFVWTSTPDRQDDPLVMVLAVRQATIEDKQKFVSRLQLRLSDAAEIEAECLKHWMVNPDLYLCIQEDKVTIIDLEYIQMPCRLEENQL